MYIDAKTLYKSYVVQEIPPEKPRSLPTLKETLALPGFAIHGAMHDAAITALLLEGEYSPQMQRRLHEPRYYAIIQALSYGIGELPLDTEAIIVLDVDYVEAFDHAYPIYFYGFGQPRIISLIDFRGGPPIPLEYQSDGTALLHVHSLTK